MKAAQPLARPQWPLYRRSLAVMREEGWVGIARRARGHLDGVCKQFLPYDPGDIYGKEFYEISRASNAYCKDLAKCLVSKFNPATFLDVGCGDCALLLAMQSLGVISCGIDGSAVAVRHAPENTLVFQARLDRPFLLSRKFMMVSCIEVAEHLPKKSAKQLVRDLVCHSARFILFSAAHPGQGGTGHLNEQPREYWEALFAGYCWTQHVSHTEELKEVLRFANAPEYLLSNIMLFESHG